MDEAVPTTAAQCWGRQLGLQYLITLVIITLIIAIITTVIC